MCVVQNNEQRKQKLKMVPKDYKKVAVYFPTPHQDVLKKRLAGRPGKSIPDYVMNTMMKTIEKPAMNSSALTMISLLCRLRSSALANCSIESPLM